MESILASLLNIVFYPFSSGTFFVTVPCVFVFVGGCFGLIRRLMGR